MLSRVACNRLQPSGTGLGSDEDAVTYSDCKHSLLVPCRTITVLLVKKDVESAEFRNAVINLDKYLKEHNLPKVNGFVCKH